MFCYQDNDNLGHKFGSFNRLNYDPNKVLKKHIENFFFLKFIISRSDDPVEKMQASKELKICDRKMSYWKKHPYFSMEEYEKDIAYGKKNYAL